MHPAGEPNLSTWTDRPHQDVVGRWSYNASFVVIAPDWIITTRHQNTNPSTVTVDSNNYSCIYNDDWIGGPTGDVDLRLIKLVKSGVGPEPNLVYAQLYANSDEIGQNIIMGGYGKGRGEPVYDGGDVIGYQWLGDNQTKRWGTNRINLLNWQGIANASIYSSYVIIAEFDTLGTTNYEAAIAEHDSGGGWFIKNGSTWELAGVMAYTQHSGQSIFDPPSKQYAIRISSYSQWISDILANPLLADITGDNWVDFQDFAVLASYWNEDNCIDFDDCDGADFEPDGDVDWDDLAFLVDRWLTGW